MRLLSSSLATALLACAAPQTLDARERPLADAMRETLLADERILVRDLAMLHPAERETIGGLVVARIPNGQDSLELSARHRTALLRRRVPGRDLRLLLGGPERFTVHRTVAEGEDGRAGRECFALRQNLAAGDYVTDRVLTPAACVVHARRGLPLRYDSATGAALLTRSLAAGTYLGPLAPAPADVVEKGRTLTLSVLTGPVRIERKVEALQSSRGGRAIFVRTTEGAVLAAPLAKAETESTAE